MTEDPDDPHLYPSTQPTRPVAEPEQGDVVAGRFELGPLIGRGGSGSVFRANDLVDCKQVAVKILLDAWQPELERIRREIAALRTLDIAGVVRLIEQGRGDDYTFLAMELVPGAPFPGTSVPCAWPDLALSTTQLLETIARVHASGIVHRDLKPNNVLVDAQGNCCVLDFGLSWGPELGRRVTSEQDIVGTPQYLAPEQIVGNSLDPRTDLYAIGVMLYEALSGKLPHRQTTFQELIRAKLVEIPSPLSMVATGVPEEVCQLVDSLLAIDIDLRPRSASEALAALHGQTQKHVDPVLPLLGRVKIMEDIFQRMESGESCHISAAPGLGKTRLLREAQKYWHARGRNIHRLIPGELPLSSLAPLLGTPDDSHRLDATLAIAKERLRVALGDGEVILCDDWELIDPWSSAIIESLFPSGPILRTGLQLTPTSHSLSTLAESDLQDLFEGPDCLLHMKSDAACELFRRTDGVPSRVVAELGAWLRCGLAQPASAHPFVVDRQALDQLKSGVAPLAIPRPVRLSQVNLSDPMRGVLTWIELLHPEAPLELLVQLGTLTTWQLEGAIAELVSLGFIKSIGASSYQSCHPGWTLHSWDFETRRVAHEKIAALLPTGSMARLRHLVRSGHNDLVIREGLVAATELHEQGKLGEASACLRSTIEACRNRANREGELAVIDKWVGLAFSLSQRKALATVLREVQQSQCSDSELEPYRKLLQAGLSLYDGGARDVGILADEIPPFANTRLELWRQSLRVQAARVESADAERAALQQVEAWARSVDTPSVWATATSWKGIHAYREGHYQEAAVLQLQAAMDTASPAAQLAAKTNAASAWLEAYQLEQAERLAISIEQLARELRLPVYEARGIQIARSARYRRGLIEAPYPELAEAAALLGNPNLEGTILLQEAALYWRTNQRASAHRCAELASTAYLKARNPWAARLAEALAELTRVPPRNAMVEELLTQIQHCPAPGIALQILALLLGVPDAKNTAPRFDTQLWAARIPKDCWLFPREILSVAECLAIVN